MFVKLMLNQVALGRAHTHLRGFELHGVESIVDQDIETNMIETVDINNKVYMNEIVNKDDTRCCTDNHL